MRDFFSNSDFNSWAVIQEEDKNISVITTQKESLCPPSLKSLPWNLKEGAFRDMFRSDMCNRPNIYFYVCALNEQSTEIYM